MPLATMRVVPSMAVADVADGQSSVLARLDAVVEAAISIVSEYLEGAITIIGARLLLLLLLLLVAITTGLSELATCTKMLGEVSAAAALVGIRLVL